MCNKEHKRYTSDACSLLAKQTLSDLIGEPSGSLIINFEQVIRSFLVLFFFFYSFMDTDDLQDSRGWEGTIFYSTLPLSPAHEHSHIYLQLYMSDDNHIFLIAPLVFTRLLLDEIYHLIELLFDILMMWSQFLFVYLMN